MPPPSSPSQGQDDRTASSDRGRPPGVVLGKRTPLGDRVEVTSKPEGEGKMEAPVGLHVDFGAPFRVDVDPTASMLGHESPSTPSTSSSSSNGEADDDRKSDGAVRTDDRGRTGAKAGIPIRNATAATTSDEGVGSSSSSSPSSSSDHHHLSRIGGWNRLRPKRFRGDMDASAPREERPLSVDRVMDPMEGVEQDGPSPGDGTLSGSQATDTGSASSLLPLSADPALRLARRALSLLNRQQADDNDAVPMEGVDAARIDAEAASVSSFATADSEPSSPVPDRLPSVPSSPMNFEHAPLELVPSAELDREPREAAEITLPDVPTSEPADVPPIVGYRVGPSNATARSTETSTAPHDPTPSSSRSSFEPSPRPHLPLPSFAGGLRRRPLFPSLTTDSLPSTSPSRPPQPPHFPHSTGPRSSGITAEETLPLLLPPPPIGSPRTQRSLADIRAALAAEDPMNAVETGTGLSSNVNWATGRSGAEDARSRAPAGMRLPSMPRPSPLSMDGILGSHLNLPPPSSSPFDRSLPSSSLSGLRRPALERNMTAVTPPEEPMPEWLSERSLEGRLDRTGPTSDFASRNAPGPWLTRRLHELDQRLLRSLETDDLSPAARAHIDRVREESRQLGEMLQLHRNRAQEDVSEANLGDRTVAPSLLDRMGYSAGPSRREGPQTRSSTSSVRRSGLVPSTWGHLMDDELDRLGGFADWTSRRSGALDTNGRMRGPTTRANEAWRSGGSARSASMLAEEASRFQPSRAPPPVPFAPIRSSSLLGFGVRDDPLESFERTRDDPLRRSLAPSPPPASGPDSYSAPGTRDLRRSARITRASQLLDPSPAVSPHRAPQSYDRAASPPVYRSSSSFDSRRQTVAAENAGLGDELRRSSMANALRTATAADARRHSLADSGRPNPLTGPWPSLFGQPALPDEPRRGGSGSRTGEEPGRVPSEGPSGEQSSRPGMDNSSSARSPTESERIADLIRGNGVGTHADPFIHRADLTRFGRHADLDRQSMGPIASLSERRDRILRESEARSNFSSSDGSQSDPAAERRQSLRSHGFDAARSAAAADERTRRQAAARERSRQLRQELRDIQSSAGRLLPSDPEVDDPRQALRNDALSMRDWRETPDPFASRVTRRSLAESYLGIRPIDQAPLGRAGIGHGAEHEVVDGERRRPWAPHLSPLNGEDSPRTARHFRRDMDILFRTRPSHFQASFRHREHGFPLGDFMRDEDMARFTYDDWTRIARIARVDRGPTGLSSDRLSALPKTTYQEVKGCGEGEGHEKECPVCKDDYEDTSMLVTLPCAHAFHQDCMTQWFVAHSTCPMCRHDCAR